MESEYSFCEKIILRTPRFPFSNFFSNTELSEIFKQSDFNESIYIASPELFEVIKSKNKNLDSFNALIKYYIRASFRCTPFGLFAGCSTVKWDKSTDIRFKCEQRHTRLDMYYLADLAFFLSRHENIRNELSFYANNTLYKTGSNLR